MENKKKSLKIWIGMACLLLLCFFYLDVRAQTADEEISISAVCGYDGYGKIGRYIPVKVTVKTTREFSGRIRIVVPANDGNNNYAYEYVVYTDGMNPVTITAEVPMISKYTGFCFELLDEIGNVCATTQVQVKTTNKELYVGVLSKNKDAVNAFDGGNIGEYTDSSFTYIKTRAFKLNTADIEQNTKRLDSLDVIIIDKSNGSNLTETQLQILEKWVTEGGVLIVESKVGQFLFDRFIYPVTEAIEEKPQLWIKKQVIQDGIVGYARVDATEIDLMEYAVDSKSIPETLIGKICSAEKINDIVEKDYYYNGQEVYDRTEKLLNVGIGKKLPNLSIYIFIIILYLFLIGPVLYYILKKREKTHLTSTAVTILSIAFSLFIYLMGSSTRFKEPFIRYASIWELEGSKVTEQIYLDLKAPFNKGYTLGISPDYEIKPISKGSHFYYEDTENSLIHTDYQVGFFFTLKGTQITMKKSAPFSSQYFLLEKDREEKDMMEFEAEVNYFNEEVTGQVSNQTEMDLEDVVLLVGGRAISIGNLKSKETIEIKNAEKFYYSPNSYKEIAGKIVGLDNLKEGTDSKLYVNTIEKRNLLESYLELYDAGTEKEGLLLAFLPTGEYSTFQIETSYQADGMTMLCSKISLNTVSDGLVYQNLTSEEINNIDKEPSYNAKTDSIYNHSIRLEYNLGDREGLKKVRFSPRIVEEGNQYYHAFSGDAYFYNPSTLEYELVDLNHIEFNIETIDKYLTEKNGVYSLIVQYTETDSSEKYEEIRLPLVSVIRKK